MRTRLLIVAVLAGTLVGGSCLPVLDDTQGSAIPGESLGVAVSEPAADRTVPQGTPVSIKWSIGNLTGEPATLKIYVESRADLSQTVLLDGFQIEDTGDAGTLTWDTGSASGLYAIYAQLTAAGLTRVAAADGKVTVDRPPQFEFTAPTRDVTYQPGTGEPLVIAWEGFDDDGTVQLGLDEDATHDSGNEILIHEADLPTTSEAGTFSWTGDDQEGDPVAAGTYFLFARLSDAQNPVSNIDGLGQITVAEEEEPPAEEEPAIVRPDEDTDFLTTDDPLEIEYVINRDDDVLVDIKLDTDDDHANGNELVALAQEFVEGDTDPDVFEWDGTTAAGDPVRDGIYRIFLAISTGSGAPTTVNAEGLVFRRSDEDQPLIGLLAPAALTRVDPGAYVSIRWRDDDPTEEATIRIVLDNDPDPSSDNGDQIEILSDREAEGDGVQDTFTWQVPGTVAPGTYYIIAYIESGSLISDSVAAPRLIVNDPEQQ